MNTILPTTLVGSYPQPDWLIDRAKLAGRFPPRVRAKELWRVAPEWLEQAQDDAALLAIRDQERAGLDIITDGEMRRGSYSDVKQISIETAQSHLDCKVLAALSSKIIMLGVLDLADMTVETPAIVADRIRRALPYVEATKIVVAPDCGLKYLPRDVAFGKMRAMVEGARVVRREVT